MIEYVNMRPNLPVRDVAASVLFYRDVIGLTLVTAFEDGSFALLKSGGAELALVKNASPGKQGAFLYVTGIAELHDRCIAYNVQEVAPLTPHPWSLVDFVIADPDGHWLAIGERLE